MLINNKSILLALTIAISTPALSAQAANPSSTQQSCEMVTALIGGHDTGVARIRPLLIALGKEKINLLVSRMSKILAKKRYTNGTVYNIGSLGGGVDEHLLVMEQGKGGFSNFYRFIYQSSGQKMRVVEFSFEPTFKGIMKRNYISEPKELPCG